MEAKILPSVLAARVVEALEAVRPVSHFKHRTVGCFVARIKRALRQDKLATATRHIHNLGNGNVVVTQELVNIELLALPTGLAPSLCSVRLNLELVLKPL